MLTITFASKEISMGRLILANATQVCGVNFKSHLTHLPRTSPLNARSPMKPLHTNPLKRTRAEIRRRICAMPVSRQQVRLMQKVIAELRRENALLTYMLSIR